MVYQGHSNGQALWNRMSNVGLAWGGRGVGLTALHGEIHYEWLNLR